MSGIIAPKGNQRELEAELTDLRTAYTATLTMLHKAIVGQEVVVDAVLTAVLLQGHVLLEGVPGLGKTYLMSNLGQATGLHASRVQFTPDLMPADILGTRMLEHDAQGGIQFTFEKGPVFTQILLADEINRATPKTQSALLEAMQEHRVTTGGTTYELPKPFMVMATQNPLEQEGTYPLPEAQLDRFLFKLIVRFPTELELIQIAERTVLGTTSDDGMLSAVTNAENLVRWNKVLKQLHISKDVIQYASQLILATHPREKRIDPKLAGLIRYGASPRGLQALLSAARLKAVIDGRSTPNRHDVNAVALPCLRHRVLLSFEAESEGVNSDDIIEKIIQRLNG